MPEQDLKTRIKQVAVDHFDRHGYYGATIRNIAADVSCSLPMVYYYYKNKQELFHEIIRKDYFELLKKQAENAKDQNIVDFYVRYVHSLHFLSEEDRKIYRLGVKVYLGFDGDEELQKVMDAWEQTIFPRHYQLVMPHLSESVNGPVVVRTLVHLLENMVEAIVVKNRTLKETEIREELCLVLAGAL